MDIVGKKAAIQGIVTVSDWDENDEILGIKILASDEQEYLITDVDMMEELVEYLQNEIEVTGTVSLNEDGENVIDIDSYEILTLEYDQDSDWDDEEYGEEEVEDFEEPADMDDMNDHDYDDDEDF